MAADGQEGACKLARDFGAPLRPEKLLKRRSQLLHRGQRPTCASAPATTNTTADDDDDDDAAASAAAARREIAVHVAQRLICDALRGIGYRLASSPAGFIGRPAAVRRGGGVDQGDASALGGTRPLDLPLISP